MKEAVSTVTQSIRWRRLSSLSHSQLDEDFSKLKLLWNLILFFSPANALAGSVAFDTSGILELMTVNDVACTGTEGSLLDCPRSDWTNNICERSEMARVTCTEMDNSPPTSKGNNWKHKCTLNSYLAILLQIISIIYTF